MFKEFACGCFVLCILFFICKFILKKKPQVMSTIIWSVLGASLLGNIIYNCIVMFPDYYMDTISGTKRFGTFSENLFAYNDGWDFRDEILQPLLKNRDLKLDASADYYEKYFQLLSRSLSVEEFDEATRNAIIAHKDAFDFQCDFETFRIIDYIKEPDRIPDELTEMLDNETSPTLYIHMNSVKDSDTLICIVDADYNLYIMGENGSFSL